MAYKIPSTKPTASHKAMEFRNVYDMLDEISFEEYGNSFNELDEKEQRKLSLKLAKKSGFK